MKKQIQRIYHISLLNDESQEHDRKNFLEAMKKHSEDFTAIVLVLVLSAIMIMLALMGLV
jgi:hypothetical protein